MRTIRSFLALSAGFAFAAVACTALAADIIVPAGAHVTVEYVSASSAFVNTLAVAPVDPTQPLAVAVSGCRSVPANGLDGTILLSSTASRLHCRIELDADPETPGIQGFPRQTTLRFKVCSMTVTELACHDVWSTSPAQNRDLQEHVHAVTTGTTTVLSWEDLYIPG